MNCAGHLAGKVSSQCQVIACCSGLQGSPGSRAMGLHSQRPYCTQTEDLGEGQLSSPRRLTLTLGLWLCRGHEAGQERGEQKGTQESKPLCCVSSRDTQ